MMSPRTPLLLVFLASATALLQSPLATSSLRATTPRRGGHVASRLAQEVTEAPAPIPREAAEAEPTEVEEADAELTEKQREIARLRAAEKFIEEETGIYICKVCSYKYDPAVGQPIAGIAAGTAFKDLPAGWRCPTCRAQKDAFEPQTVTIAGFAENQQFGLGGNSMTEEGKSTLIFGSLFAFFALFMAGYLMN
mmetsp:Transcript_10181/g.41229  ORF Transcript_10181/g.41229 Transcript_10181/m.41229 type:complete len:194 (-) Transcript_10181:30-611(-)